VCSSGTTIALTRSPGTGPRWESVRLRAGGVQRRLAARHQAYEAGQRYLTDAELSARLPAAKATSERAWLTEVSAVVLQQALADLNTAYRNYFASLTGKRKGAEGWAAPVPVPQGHPAGDPVHR